MSRKYTDEEIINIYKDFASRLGKTPTQDDVNNESKSNKYFPSGKVLFSRFGGKTKLDEVCGLKLNHIYFTDNELLDKLKNFYDKNGFPIKKEINKDEDMPNAEVYRIRFGSFKDAIIKANIPIPKNKENSLKNNKVYLEDDILLEQLKQVLTTHGIIPISKFKEYGLYSMVVYRNRFGTYKEILNMLNIHIPEDIESKYFSKFKNKSNEELIIYLQDYYDKYGLPTTRDLKNNNDYPSDYIYRERFGSFENALLIANIEIPQDKEWLYNRESMDTDIILKNLKEFIYNNYTEKDILPGMKELFILCDIPSQSVLFKKFYSIQELYSQINVDYYKHNNHAIKLDMIKKYKELYSILGRTPHSRDIEYYSRNKEEFYSMGAYEFHFGSVYQLQVYCDFIPTVIGRHKSRSDLIEDLQELYERLGRIPTQKDVNMCEWMASSSSYNIEFGGFIESLKISGIINGKQNSKCSITPQGNYCRSSYEFDFCIMLENKGLSFRQEDHYSKYIKDFTRRFRFDYIVNINNIDYFIEIFGMMEHKWYSDKADYKIKLCEDNNLILIDLYKNDFKKSDIETLYNLLLNKIDNINNNLKDVS